MVTWIPSIYPLYVSINIPAPWILWGKHSMNLKRAHNSSKSTKSGGSRSRPNLLPCSPSHPLPLGSRRGMWSCLSRQLNLAVPYKHCLELVLYGFFPTKSSKSPWWNSDTSEAHWSISYFRRSNSSISAPNAVSICVNHLCWGPRPQLDWSHHRKRRQSAAAVRNIWSKLMPMILESLDYGFVLEA